MNVLVVEDNWITGEIVRTTLESRGYSVLLAPTGRMGMQLMSNHTCELVLLDLMLPDGDGAELLERLRQLPGGDRIPILAFSAFLSRMEDLRKRKARFNGYVAKPIEPHELLKVVEEHLKMPDQPAIAPV
ncbi:MAG: response regulator [Bryobacteraceae bacterium]